MGFFTVIGHRYEQVIHTSWSIPARSARYLTRKLQIRPNLWLGRFSSWHVECQKNRTIYRVPGTYQVFEIWTQDPHQYLPRVFSHQKGGFVRVCVIGPCQGTQVYVAGGRYYMVGFVLRSVVIASSCRKYRLAIINHPTYMLFNFQDPHIHQQRRCVFLRHISYLPRETACMHACHLSYVPRTAVVVEVPQLALLL